MAKREWFQEIFDRYARDLLAYARYLLRDAAGLQPDAEDYVQTTFLKVYASQDKLDGHENIEAWLKRVLKNLIVEDMRKLQMRNKKLGTPIDMEEFEKGEARYRHGIDDGILAGKAFEVCDLLKSRLSDGEYRLFAMLYLLFRPREQIAQEWHLKPNALAQRIFRLRQKIEQILQEDKY